MVTINKKRKRVKRVGKQLVQSSDQLPKVPKKISTLFEEWEKIMTTKCPDVMKRLKEYSRESSGEFLSLSWEEKKETALGFLRKYGFKVVFENRELSFLYEGVTMHTCSNTDIDGLLGGLQSAFIRLEPHIL
jgi:hypothetical protein